MKRGLSMIDTQLTCSIKIFESSMEKQAKGWKFVDYGTHEGWHGWQICAQLMLKSNKKNSKIRLCNQKTSFCPRNWKTTDQIIKQTALTWMITSYDEATKLTDEMLWKPQNHYFKHPETSLDVHISLKVRFTWVLSFQVKVRVD